MDLKFQMSEMPEDLRKIIVEYTMDHGPRPADDAILRFIGAAEMCGYKLVKQSPPVQSDEVIGAVERCQKLITSFDLFDEYHDAIKTLIRAAEQRVAGQVGIDAEVAANALEVFKVWCASARRRDEKRQSELNLLYVSKVIEDALTAQKGK